MKSTFSPKDRAVIRLLENLRSVKTAYPPKLLARRRAAFIRQIVELRKIEVNKASSLQDREIVQLLKNLKSDRVEYPSKMLSRRRVNFIKQIAEWERVDIEQKHQLQEQDVISLLESLKPVKAEYPQELLAKRRSAFVGHVLKRGKSNWWEMLRSGIQNKLIGLTTPQRTTTLGFMLASLVFFGCLVIASLGTMIYGDRDELGIAFNNSSTQQEVSKPYLPIPTSTVEVGLTICKPGYKPPTCLAKIFDRRRDLSFQGNGLARPAVAKDTIPGFSEIHQAAYVNDGLYGIGASWVSYSANSWIKIDLGQTTTINMVTFGKDRLGNFKGHNPGQFTIAVALSDNIYANGDSSNDENEYKQVYDSRTVGFTGIVSGSETVQASFKPVSARYIKITVTNSGAAIDEIEAFLNKNDQPASPNETRKHKDPIDSQSASTNTPVILPSPTSAPNDTPTPIPTDTPLPIPTDTLAPVPTDTPLPIPTDTPVPVPTDTPMSVPTDTPVPIPTDTILPALNP